MNNVIFLATDAISPTTTPAAPEAPGWFVIFRNQFFPLILGVIFLIWFMNRNKGSKEKARQDMLKQLKRGDKIQTIGGILGTVLRTEEDRVEVKVDETNNTKMWFTRSAIHQVMSEDKENAK